MKRYIFIVGMSIHFVMILWNNIQHSYYAYSKAKQRTLVSTEILRVGQRLFQHSLFPLYAKISGNDMANGFFAPNVGSQYITEFRLHYAGDSTHYVVGDPGLQNRESLNRYSSFTRLFESLLNEHDTLNQGKNLDQTYSRALASSMARYLSKRDVAISRVVVSIYLYQIAAQKNQHPTQQPYILLFQHTINL